MQDTEGGAAVDTASTAYIANTADDRQKMLRAIGVDSIAALFADVPARIREPEFSLPTSLNEIDALRLLRELSERNHDLSRYPCFLGAGGGSRNSSS
jgi:glycine dehydrogenase subunit 1